MMCVLLLQAIPANKRSAQLPNPLTKEDIIVKDSCVASNMHEDYVMFTDFNQLSREARTAYGKIDRTKLPEPVIAPKPKYLGKDEHDRFLDWVCAQWNAGQIDKNWLVAKSKDFNGIRFPSLQYHKEMNLAAARGAHPPSNFHTVHACSQYEQSEYSPHVISCLLDV